VPIQPNLNGNTRRRIWAVAHAAFRHRIDSYAGGKDMTPDLRYPSRRHGDATPTLGEAEPLNLHLGIGQRVAFRSGCRQRSGYSRRRGLSSAGNRQSSGQISKLGNALKEKKESIPLMISPIIPKISSSWSGYAFAGGDRRIKNDALRVAEQGIGLVAASLTSRRRPRPHSRSHRSPAAESNSAFARHRQRRRVVKLCGLLKVMVCSHGRRPPGRILNLSLRITLVACITAIRTCPPL